MKRSSVAARLLVGTALCFPFAGAVHSQALVDITEEELAGKSQECQSLAEEYQGDDDPTVVSEDDVITAINEDNAEECARLEEEVSANETQTQQETTGATLTEQQQTEQTEAEEVDLSEEATIEGEAQVTIPEPDVDVDVPAPTVQVDQQAPQVNITEAPSELQVQQERPQISVEIPEIRVRVQIPAPQFYMLEGEPQVEVGTQDPQIQVEQGDPTVDVSQADPELNLDLSEGDSPDGQQTADGGSVDVGADVSVSDSSQARVVISEAEGEPRVTLQRSQPNLSYESQEPEVQILMAEQPTVEIEQTGEPSLTVETQEERQQRQQEQQAQQEQQEEAAQQEQQSEQATGDTASLEAEQTEEQSEQATAQTTGATSGAAVEQSGEATTTPGDGMMTVGELTDMEVVTAGGENLGNPEAVVELNGEPHIVLSHGGFLGLGAKQVPVSLSRVTVENERLLLDSMTEEDIEAANDFQYDSNLELEDDREISVSGG